MAPVYRFKILQGECFRVSDRGMKLESSCPETKPYKSGPLDLVDVAVNRSAEKSVENLPDQSGAALMSPVVQGGFSAWAARAFEATGEQVVELERYDLPLAVIRTTAQDGGGWNFETAGHLLASDLVPEGCRGAVNITTGEFLISPQPDRQVKPAEIIGAWGDKFKATIVK